MVLLRGVLHTQALPQQVDFLLSFLAGLHNLVRETESFVHFELLSTVHYLLLSRGEVIRPNIFMQHVVIILCVGTCTGHVARITTIIQVARGNRRFSFVQHCCCCLLHSGNTRDTTSTACNATVFARQLARKYSSNYFTFTIHFPASRRYHPPAASAFAATF